VAIVFFFTPLALLIVGVRPSNIENHAPSRFPHLQASWATFDRLNTYFSDNLPLRDVAIRDNERLSESLFGQPAPRSQGDSSVAGAVTPGVVTSPTTTAPAEGADAPPPKQTEQQNFLRLPPPAPEPPESSNDEVTVGQGGWLYLTGEFYKECEPGQPPTTVIANLQRLQKILAASGRTFIFTLAPDKSAAEPQFLPSNYPDQSCAPAAKQQTFSLLNQARIPGYIDMKDLIAEHQIAEGRLYYLRKDTHWNSLADVLFAEQIAQRLDPTLLDGLISTESITSYVGDLTVLLGDPTADRTITDKLTRPGVTTSQATVSLAPGISGTESKAVSGAAPLVGGRTLLVGDSFSEAVQSSLVPFFSDLLSVKNAYFAEAPETMFDAMASSKTIILVWNERYFADPNYGVMWSTAFLDKLQADLKPI
jgi:hypothetical protein